MAANYSDRDLSFVPDLTFSMVETFITSLSSNSGKKHFSKGVLYYKEAYVHALSGKLICILWLKTTKSDLIIWID